MPARPMHGLANPRRACLSLTIVPAPEVPLLLTLLQETGEEEEQEKEAYRHREDSRKVDDQQEDSEEDESSNVQEVCKVRRAGPVPASRLAPQV